MGTVIPLRPRQHQRMRVQILPKKDWQEPTTQFLDHLRASHAPNPTLKLRSYYLRRYAANAPHSPWQTTTIDLIEYINRNEWGAPAIKSFRSTMREFYRWAILTDQTVSNPAEKLRRIYIPTGTPRPASDDALNTALETADDRVRLMVELAAYAGLRCREVARVRRQDVQADLLGWSLYVDGKGSKVRRIPIPDWLAEKILQHDDGYLFPGLEDGHLSAPYVSKRISKVLPGATAHQLRHRYATRAYQLGGHDIRAVQELLGHASLNTTQIYTAVEAEALRSAALAAAA